MRKEDKELLEQIHGEKVCDICGMPCIGEGSPYCSYPHARLPYQPVEWHPEGFLSWYLPQP